MNTERHELGRLILGRTVTTAVEAILAAGYRKPRTITTVEELDALPYESVIVDAYDTPYVCERHKLDGTCNEWRMAGMGGLFTSDDVLLHGPAAVAWEPQP